ncbi:hypothetical protein BH10ACI3_BH10ACI3_07060 [soil metagenome]
MTPERWQQIKPILEEALELAPDVRLAYLQKTCVDLSVLADASSLIELERANDDPLDSSAFSIVTGNGAFKPDEAFIGSTIGKYKIISKLGVGGMGAVFLAERSDGEFQQKVAIKLIKSGIGSESILSRFYAERQILASLDHPNIAHMIDGGTTDEGLPYLVMEYVKGETIIEFARSRDLSLDQMLDLFREVCAAVSFAHQNLVIHRDLKPTNIIVNAEGTPKLLDFGIAKLLKEENIQETSTQHAVFTPEYASPEQIRGENLTTATDLYSLGVILYELLTGVRPFSFDGKNFGQIIDTATQVEPLKPSSAAKPLSTNGRNKADQSKPLTSLPSPQAKALRGDLDNIILKALKKEPERRYSSVERFSEDIRRHLKGLPVFARNESWRYRAGKFIQRNPLVVGSAALAFVILIAGIVATTYQARRADAERAKAEQRFNEVRALANSFIFEVNDKIQESPIKARELLVSRSIEYLDKLAAESEGDTGLQAELAAAYGKIGDVQAEIFRPNLGNASGSLESHTKALKLRRRLFDGQPADIQRGLDLAQSYHKVGNILSMTGKIESAFENYKDAVTLCENLSAADPANNFVKVQLSNSYILIGQAILRSGSLSESLQNYEKAFEIESQLIASDPTNLEYLRKHSVAYSYIGYVKVLMGKFSEAVSDFKNALAIDQEILKTDPQNLRLQSYLSSSYLFLGIGERENKAYSDSLSNIKSSLEIQQHIFDLDNQNYGEQNSLADCYLELALTLSKEGRQTHAIEPFQAAVRNYSAVATNDAANISARGQIYLTKRLLANSFLEIGKTANALGLFDESLKVFTELNSIDANNLEWKFDTAVCYARIGMIRLAQKDKDAASVAFQNALPIFESLAATSPENVNYERELTDLQNQIASLGR